MSRINVRVKKGVRPYGGRTLEVAEFKVYPNGRKVVIALPPSSHRSRHQGIHLGKALSRLGRRTLEYNIDEVEGAFAAAERSNPNKEEQS